MSMINRHETSFGICWITENKDSKGFYYSLMYMKRERGAHPKSLLYTRDSREVVHKKEELIRKEEGL